MMKEGIGFAKDGHGLGLIEDGWGISKPTSLFKDGYGIGGEGWDGCKDAEGCDV